STKPTLLVGSRKILMGSPQDAVCVGQVLAFELISVRLPLYKLMAKELTLLPRELLKVVPSVSTYRSPAGRDDELPQLTRSKLEAQRPRRATTKPNFFDICSPSRFPFAGGILPAVTEIEACG